MMMIHQRHVSLFTCQILLTLFYLFTLCNYVNNSSPCPIPSNHFLTDTTDLGQQTLETNTPLYYGFKVPQSWNVKGNASIPTVIFRIEYPSIECTTGEHNTSTNVEPILKIGLNTKENTNNDAQCSQLLRTVVNMTTTYQDVANRVYIQYIALYPYEIKQYSGSGQMEYALILQQSNCNSHVPFFISATYQKDIDLNLQPLQTIVFPGLKQFFKFSVDRTVGDNKILFGSLQFEPSNAQRTIHFRENDYPSGVGDHMLGLDSFSISPAPLYSVFYFYLEFMPATGIYAQTEAAVSLLITWGSLCRKGCGSGGTCNFTTGECSCYHDKGYYGDDCTLTGCKDGQECSDDNMSGTLQCNGPDWAKSICIIQKCKKSLQIVDAQKNKCIRSFPVYLFASVTAGASIIAAVFGLSLGLGICHACSGRIRRRHYHYVK